jgi:MSHA biogenesis protein MshN
MGLFEMSLINKMLQDLEGRRSEGEVVGAMHGQLRAAPDSPRIHVAWWLVLGLTLLLTGVISWLWGRETAPTVVMAQPQLALKLAPGLSTVQPPILKNPAIEGKNVALPAGTAPLPSSVKEADVKIALNSSVNSANDAPRSNAAIAQPTKSAPMPAQIATAAPIMTKGTAEPAAQAEKTTDFDIPSNVSKQIKELTPQQRAENEYRRATVLIQQAKTAESISVLEQALQIDPQHSVARQTLVGLLLENKRQDDAIRKLQEGVNLDRTQPGLAMMLARLQVEKGDLRPAIDTLQRTLPYATERGDYQAFLAALFQREGRNKDAVDHYSLALRKSPQNGLWWMGLGISLQAENRVPEARDAFGRARATNTLSPELAAFVDQKLNQLR